jgi:hypothetical protein
VRPRCVNSIGTLKLRWQTRWIVFVTKHAPCRISRRRHPTHNVVGVHCRLLNASYICRCSCHPPTRIPTVLKSPTSRISLGQKLIANIVCIGRCSAFILCGQSAPRCAVGKANRTAVRVQFARKSVRAIVFIGRRTTVRDRTRIVDLKQVNRVLLQPHWRQQQDLNLAIWPSTSYIGYPVHKPASC